MENAPIDVKYNDLLQWLEERYLIPKDWPKRLEIINLKKEEIVKELYEKETEEFKKIKDSFSKIKNEMNFNDYMRLNQMLLKTEEAKNKTLFGGYQSTLIKNSNLLNNLYNKNNMNLCEFSKIILQNIGYEIPNLERTNGYIERQVAENNLKVNEKRTNIERNLGKLDNLAKSLNINLSDLRNVDLNLIAKEIVKRLSAIPGYLEKIENLLKNKKIEEIINFYIKFQTTLYKELKDVIANDSNSLPTLKTFYKHGNFNTKTLKSSNNNNNLIENKISELTSKYENIRTIKDISDEWKFAIVDQSSDSTNFNENTCLLDSKWRQKLINDLTELQIFLEQRRNQMQNNDEMTLSMYNESLQSLNLEFNSDKIKDMINFLKEIENLLKNKDFLFLLNIFENSKMLDRILESFDSLHQENKNLMNHIRGLEERNIESEKEIIENRNKIQQIKKDSKMIKKQMEKLMTDQIKRKVTIIGDINLL